MVRISALFHPAVPTITATIISGVSLSLVRFGYPPGVPGLDPAALFLVFMEILIRFRNAPVKRTFLLRDIPGHALFLVALIVFAGVFSGHRLFSGALGAHQTILIIRNVLLLSSVLPRLRRVSSLVTDLVLHPARTVAFSFLLVIIVGSLVLMMPFTTVDAAGLSAVDALFTATSAVCVTGLIVVDTATVFSTAGRIVIMVLIQIGGLGIMILSLFAIVLLRQSMSVENQVLLSYMLSEARITELSHALKRIVVITFGVEAAGAVLLFFLFAPVSPAVDERVLLAVFHSVSAFCNAGFALFSTSLEQFRGSLGINLTIGALIIAGGLSFTVLTNTVAFVKTFFAVRIRRQRTQAVPLTVNTRAVLAVTAILLGAAFFGFYALEHGHTMATYPLGTQYLAAAFQAITLRTAGFNTVPLEGITTATILMMSAFMFIGGAAGSTAGGLKVNNLAVIVAFLESMRRKRRQTLLFGHAVSDRRTAIAFTVLVFGLFTVLATTFLLSLTEVGTLGQHLFESVSAFATVGLSTGITPDLTVFGRLVITITMFVGRVGPLTLLAASTGGRDRMRIEYPSAAINAG